MSLTINFPFTKDLNEERRNLFKSIRSQIPATSVPDYRRRGALINLFYLVITSASCKTSGATFNGITSLPSPERFPSRLNAPTFLFPLSLVDVWFWLRWAQKNHQTVLLGPRATVPVHLCPLAPPLSWSGDLAGKSGSAGGSVSCDLSRRRLIM